MQYNSAFDTVRERFVRVHLLYFILKLGDAVHMRQFLQHCAALQPTGAPRLAFLSSSESRCKEKELNDVCQQEVNNLSSIVGPSVFDLDSDHKRLHLQPLLIQPIFFYTKSRDRKSVV